MKVKNDHRNKSSGQFKHLERRILKYGKSHGRLDPILRMHKVALALNRVLTRAKPPVFGPEVFSVKMRYFSDGSSVTGYKKSNQAKSVGESFTVRICINVLQDLSKYAPLQCSLTRAS